MKANSFKTIVIKRGQVVSTNFKRNKEMNDLTNFRGNAISIATIDISPVVTDLLGFDDFSDCTSEATLQQYNVMVTVRTDNDTRIVKISTRPFRRMDASSRIFNVDTAALAATLGLSQAHLH